MPHEIQVDATFGVAPWTAAMVGEWYLHSRSAHRDPQVIQAYRQLQAETDHLFTLLTRGVRHRTVRVMFTRCVQPYESDEELIFDVRANGALEITSAATAGGQRLHPLFDCEFGGAFDRFRAVHDLIGHAGCGYRFDLDDERAAWSRSRPPAQRSRTVRSCYRVIWSERRARHHRRGAGPQSIAPHAVDLERYLVVIQSNDG